tara:strand:+ start:656 stop:1060 length:405 start_codon:yes stop_codon:yes gene_type:complete
MNDNNYGKYWYFRTVADEDSEIDQAQSIMLPIKDVVSMIPTATTTMRIYFDKGTYGVPHYETTATGRLGYIGLTIKQGKVKDTIADLIASMNAGPKHSDGVTVIADDTTTDFDGTTRAAKYFSHITACETIRAR